MYKFDTHVHAGEVSFCGLVPGFEGCIKKQDIAGLSQQILWMMATPTEP
jgi:hypothetical protein